MQSIQKRALNEHIFGKNINNHKMLDLEAFRNVILSVWIYAIQLSIVWVLYNWSWYHIHWIWNIYTVHLNSSKNETILAFISQQKNLAASQEILHHSFRLCKNMFIKIYNFLFLILTLLRVYIANLISQIM